MTKNKLTPEQEDAKNFLKTLGKEKKAAARKPFTDILQNNWRTIKIVAVVLFFTSVVAMGAAGVWYGVNRIDITFWQYIVTFCGATTALTGLGAMAKGVEKVSN